MQGTATEQASITIKAAKYYFNAGLKPIPLIAGQKRPRPEGWQQGYFHNVEDIAEHYVSHPDDGVGLVCGEQSDFFALDIDAKTGGFESLAALIEEHGQLPPTIEAKTGGGGAHYLFKYPAGRYRIRNRAGVLPGVDVRGGFNNDEGEPESTGQVAVFPTFHPSGHQYRWVAAPWETPLADAPEWLLELISTPAPPRAFETPGGKVPLGQRHDFLVHEAARLRGLGYDHSTITGMISVLYAERCSQDPPITDEEIAEIGAWFADKATNDDIGTAKLMADATAPVPEEGGLGWSYTGNALTLGQTAFKEVSLPFFDISTDLVIPEKAWWWADRIPHPASVLIHGDAKLGKTESTQRLLDSAFKEGSFLGDFTTGFSPKVIYLEEEGAGDMQAKLTSYGWSADQVVALSADDLYGLGWMPLMASVLNHAVTSGFNLIVIDTLFTYFQLPSDQQMNGFTISQNLRALFSYAKKHGISVWCLHHDNADGTAYRKNEMKAQFDVLVHHVFDVTKDLDTWTFEGRYFGKPKPEPIHYRFDGATGERHLTTTGEVAALSTRSSASAANQDRLEAVQRILVEAQPDGVTVKDVMAKGLYWDGKTVAKWLDIAVAIAGDNGEKQEAAGRRPAKWIIHRPA